MTLSRKKILTLGFGVWALGFGLWAPEAWAMGDVTSFGSIKRIVIFQHLNPWMNTKENLDNTDSAIKELHLTKNIDIQNAAADYVRKNLNEKFKKCIEIVVPKNAPEYYNDPQNRLLEITWDVSQWRVDGKLQTLGSFSLSEMHPNPQSDRYFLRTPIPMPVQSMFFRDEAQINADIKVVAERLMTKIVHYINNADNSCN